MANATNVTSHVVTTETNCDKRCTQAEIDAVFPSFAAASYFPSFNWLGLSKDPVVSACRDEALFYRWCVDHQTMLRKDIEGRGVYIELILFWNHFFHTVKIVQEIPFKTVDQF